MSALRGDATTASPTIRVLIVEDHSILTESLSLTLRLEGIEPIVATGLDDATVLDHARALEPDVVLLDLHLEGGRNSVPMIGPLVALGSSVLVLTGSADAGLHGIALEEGAAGVLAKSAGLATLCQAIRDVEAGHSVMPPTRRSELLERGRERREVQARLATLSAREGEVLAALTNGTPAEIIAAEQYVAVGTVRTQIRSILRKLGVNSQLAAVAAARQAGWHGG